MFLLFITSESVNCGKCILFLSLRLNQHQSHELSVKHFQEVSSIKCNKLMAIEGFLKSKTVLNQHFSGFTQLLH